MASRVEKGDQLVPGCSAVPSTMNEDKSGFGSGHRILLNLALRQFQQALPGFRHAIANHARHSIVDDDSMRRRRTFGGATYLDEVRLMAL